MNTTRLSLSVLAAGFTAIAGLSAPFSAHAAQGEGELAQYPLSITNVIQPAFIMAIDDSGSMRFQGVFNGVEASACWDGSSFFAEPGVLNASGGTCTSPLRYYVYTHIGARVGAAGEAGFPQTDNFGFARSPQFNRGYFNPVVTYGPWLEADGTPYAATADNPQGNASVTATRIDPRETATINLFQNRRNTTDFIARSRAGMVIPSGTVYFNNNNTNGARCNLHSNLAAVREDLGNNWFRLRQDRTLNGDCNNLYFEYYPATFYLRTDTPAAEQPAGYLTTAAARPVIADGCGAGCDLWRYEIRPANFSSPAAYEAMRQNFANWFSYYGNRNRALIAGMTRAFADVNNIRVGYFTINVRPAGNLPMYDLAVPADKETVFSQILSMPAVGGTPNPDAVRYGMEQFMRTDADAPVQLACQKNALLLFTDGYSNANSVTAGQAPAIEGLGRPFDPTPARSMAAIATRYYLNVDNTIGPGSGSRIDPLNRFPRGQVPVPAACENPPSGYDPDFARLNCQSNLHVNFYGIVLGPSGERFNANDPKDPFVDDIDEWPGYEAAQPSTIDDIWHAAINTRGEFIDASTPADIITALRRVLAAVGGGESPSGSIALTGARVGDGAFTVEPAFESRNEGTDWFGRLTGFNVEVTPAGQFEFFQSWEAGALLPGPGGRNIFFARPDGTTTSPTVLPFTGANVGSLANLCNGPLSLCSGAQLAALRSPAVSVNEAVAYLAGDRTLENAGVLRERSSRLADIVNSSPVISEKTDNYGYRSLRGATVVEADPLGYAAFLQAKAEGNRPRMVYVGSNGGKLHGFNGETGVEEFAFIPSTALGHMGNLLFPYRAEDQQDQRFQHRFYVDGQVAVSDARLGTQWTTVLVGASGAGGRSVFGLDVGSPTSFSADDVLWEITPAAAGAAGEHIGNVLGQPVIVPVREGTQTRWKALFGNGYGSESGKPALFVVDMQTGASTVIVAEDSAADAPDRPNGLGNIVAIDRWNQVSGPEPVAGNDGRADTVYGGDLHGNIWKFDLRSNSVAFGGEPLFTARDKDGNRQPVTGGLEIAAGPGGGVMVYFGTGAFAFVNDAVDESVQSLYGILDSGTPVENRSALREQSITASGDAAMRNIESSSVSFLDRRGWVIDLVVNIGGEAVAGGERFVGNPRLSEGTIFFPTFDPGGEDATVDPCAPGGVNWLYALNALSGGGAMSGLRVGSPDADPLASGTGAVQLADAGQAPVRDVAVALVPQRGALGADATPQEIAAALDETCDKVISTAGGFVAYQARACGRQSWRQVR